MTTGQKAGAPTLSEAAEVANATRLARQLIRHLGVSGATRTCRENHWDGVLAEVQAQARHRSTI